MSSQYPGQSGGQDQSGPGATPPNPFSREAAGDDAGLGPADDYSTEEPSGYVGTPGGPGTPDPYSGSGTDMPYAPPAGAPTPSDPYQPADPYAAPSQPADSQGPQNPYDTSYGPVPSQPTYPPNPYAGYGYGSSMPYGYVPPEQHPKGTTALVMGIIGIVLCPFVGVAGFFISSRARREINAEPHRYSNGGMVTAGWVLGIISIVYASFAALYLVVVIIAVIGGVLAES